MLTPATALGAPYARRLAEAGMDIRPLPEAGGSWAYRRPADRPTRDMLPMSPAPIRTAGAAAPQVGQQGKDVIWVPTPDALVNRMLTMA